MFKLFVILKYECGDDTWETIAGKSSRLEKKSYMYV